MSFFIFLLFRSSSISDSFQRNSKQFSFFYEIDKYYEQNFNVKNV